MLLGVNLEKAMHVLETNIWGVLIRAYSTFKGVGRNQMAERSGVSMGRLYRITNGTTKIREVEKIALRDSFSIVKGINLPALGKTIAHYLKTEDLKTLYIVYAIVKLRSTDPVYNTRIEEHIKCASLSWELLIRGVSVDNFAKSAGVSADQIYGYLSLKINVPNWVVDVAEIKYGIDRSLINGANKTHRADIDRLFSEHGGLVLVAIGETILMCVQANVHTFTHVLVKHPNGEFTVYVNYIDNRQKDEELTESVNLNSSVLLGLVTSKTTLIEMGH